MKFTKMHGIGNDFVMVNGFEFAVAEESAADLARQVCDRRFGIGGDGLIVASPGRTENFAMRMWNPDGSEAEMCGNGIRCFATFVREKGLTVDRTLPVETGAGTLTVEIVGENLVRVDMGPARLTRGEIGMAGPETEEFVAQPIDVDGQEVRATAVSMGNPHVVIFVDDLTSIDLDRLGPLVEHNSLFPKRVNAHWVKVDTDSHITMKTWERGAGVTLACGTGACACAVASFLNGKTGRRVTVQLPGGELAIEYADDGNVLMTGPAETVFEGDWS